MSRKNLNKLASQIPPEMPALILDKSKCLRNIERMVQKAKTNQLGFRPHCKTHQSAEVGNWIRDFGVSKITVSSFRMAAYFAKAGWDDILVAFPFIPGEINTLNQISGPSKVSVLIDNVETLPYLRDIEKKVNFYIDIDTGYGRTGVKSESADHIYDIIQESSNHKNLVFSGFYCHAGHSYKPISQSEREKIHLKAITDLKSLKDQFSEYDLRIEGIVIRNCSIQQNFDGIDEITPGNFVFYDLVQRSIGSCSTEDIAVAMSCPVAGKYQVDKKLLIHGGAVHFSKEFLEINGKPVFGEVVISTSNGWKASSQASYITSISQEHGILENCGELFDRSKINDKLYILRPHSCLTAILMREYRTLEGEIITTINS